MKGNLSGRASHLLVAIACTFFSIGNWAKAVVVPAAENIQKIVPSDIIGNDLAGKSVAVAGNVAVVGVPNGWRSSLTAGDARGVVYVFRYNGLTWVQEQKLFASDAGFGDQFGRSVAVGSNMIVVGAPYDDDQGSDSGSIYVFKYNGVSWQQSQKFRPADGLAGDNCAYSLALSESYLIVSSVGNDQAGPNLGAAYIFRYDGSNWIQQQKVLPPTNSVSWSFGSPVAINGDVAVVGSSIDASVAPQGGAAYVYRLVGSTWSLQSKLTPSDAQAYQVFGSAVAASTNTVIVGSPKDNDVGNMSGSAYIFRFNATTQQWVQEAKLVDQTPQAPSGQPGNQFGYSVSISGNKAVIGSPWWDDQTVTYPAQDQGAAYVYFYDAQTFQWRAESRLVATDGYYFDNMGNAVAMSGDVVVTGAANNDSKAMDSGAGYIFELSPSAPLPGCLTGSDCNDSNPCTTDSCVSGSCVNQSAPNGTACGSATATDCSLADTCLNGACSPNNKASGTACTEDGNMCTSDTCNGSGSCTHPYKASGSTCSDGLYCNGTDTCNASGVCIHSGNPCPGPDGDADCSETCNEAVDACTANDPTGALCNDGNAATTNDKCSAGVCSGTAGTPCTSAANCNDNNPCTTDSCVSGVCQRTNNTLACADDGNACTSDVCSAGACTHPAQTNGTTCGTSGGTCNAGTCVVGTQCTSASNCNDNNPCTTDSCVSGVCQRVNNTLACNDGLYCNGADTCSNGSCSVHSGNPCTGADGDGNCLESCNEAMDNCTGRDPDNSTCSDGVAATVGDYCYAGQCVPGQVAQCKPRNQSCSVGSECCSEVCGRNGRCK